jgi:hypothetical protein
LWLFWLHNFIKLAKPSQKYNWKTQSTMAATYRTYLRNTIGFGTNDRVTTIGAHGLDNFDTMAELEDDDVKTLFNAARKQTPPMLVSAIIEKRIKLACYGARTYTIIGRDVDGTSLSLRRLKQLELHKKIIEEHKDPSEGIPKVSKTYSIDKALDTLPTFLRSKIGVRGVALSYVIREVAVPPALDPLHTDVPYSQESGSLMNELITHTPHDGVGWDEDNASVFAIIQEMVRDVSMASSLKGHQRARNGRAAYLSLVQHNLGSAQWDKVLLKAEEVQNVRVWNGRNGRYTMKRHIDMHRDAFNDMVRANEHVAYEVPNERTRVSRLLRSIQAGHLASIAAAKTTIEATPAKRDDFEEAADFLILNAPAIKNSGSTQRISGLYQEGDEEDLSHVKVDDRFYTPKEYKDLSQDQKHKLKLLREKRGNDAGKGGKRGNTSQGKGNKKKLKKMKKDNKTMKQRIAALESQLSSQDDTDSSSSDDAEKKDKEKEKSVRFNQRKD